MARWQKHVREGRQCTRVAFVRGLYQMPAVPAVPVVAGIVLGCCHSGQPLQTFRLDRFPDDPGPNVLATTPMQHHLDAIFLADLHIWTETDHPASATIRRTLMRISCLGC